MTEGNGRLVVLFDRDCDFCGWTVNQLRRFDRPRRLEFVPLQDAPSSARPMLVRVAAERRLIDELHVIDEQDGTVRAGGGAALAILEALPGGRFVRMWAAVPVVPPIVNVAYRVVARNRQRIGPWLGLDRAACVVPPDRPAG